MTAPPPSSGSEPRVLLEEPRQRVHTPPPARPRPLTHREVPNPERVLQEALERHGPAGSSPLSQAPAALHAWEAGIAAQTVVAHAVLQVGAGQLCGASTHLTCPGVPRTCPGGGGALPNAPSLKHALGQQSAPSAHNTPGAVLGTGDVAWNTANPSPHTATRARTRSRGAATAATRPKPVAERALQTQRGSQVIPRVRLGRRRVSMG